jgi:hypothetical protein
MFLDFKFMVVNLSNKIYNRFKVMAVGVNCVNPKDVTSLLTMMNTVNHWSAWPNVFNYEKVPYVVYPNAGSIDDWDHVNKRWAKDGNISDILENVKVIFGNTIDKKCCLAHSFFTNRYNFQEWMCLGANIIGGCCRIGPDSISKISESIITNIFEAKRYREVEDKKTRSSSEEWSSVLERLKKSSYADQKKQEQVSNYLDGMPYYYTVSISGRPDNGTLIVLLIKSRVLCFTLDIAKVEIITKLCFI